MHGLIGYTGFVGGNLAAQREYQALYNSRNFKEMAGKHFSRLGCAGVSVHNKDGYNTILLNKEDLVKLSGHDTVLINGTRRKILSVDSSNGYMIVDGAKLSGDRNVKLGIHI